MKNVDSFQINNDVNEKKRKHLFCQIINEPHNFLFKYQPWNGKDFLDINSFPNDKILALTKLEALADDRFNVVCMMISVSDVQENIVGKGENAGYQHFLLFPQCFQKPFSVGP